MTSPLEPRDQDSQVTTTAIIWGFATGMLALAIPLTAVSQQSMLIVGVVLLGAAIATTAVWISSSFRLDQGYSIDRIKLLEERIANLEEICSREHLDLPPSSTKLELPENNLPPSDLNCKM